MTNIVLFHKACSDGYCAFVIAKNAEQAPTLYYPLVPHRLEHQLARVFQDVTDQGLELSSIRSFDLAFTPAALDMCTSRCSDVLIFDHHKSTLDNFAQRKSSKLIFDNDKSGARLAWDYYHPDEPAPLLVAYIEARDLWQFNRVANSRAVTDVLYAMLEPHGLEGDNLTHWTSLLSYGEAEFQPILDMAPTLQQVKQLQVNSALSKGSAHRWAIGGQDLRVFIVNSDTHISDLGNSALEKLDDDGQRKHDLALIWYWNERKRTFHVSLRSCPASPADAQQIAARFGGGGHRNAAGFTCQTLDFLKGSNFPQAKRAYSWPWIAVGAIAAIALYRWL